MKTDLEIAAALRKCVDFCEDPDAPRCTHEMFRTASGKSLERASEGRAASWCVLGYLHKTLGLRTPKDESALNHVQVVAGLTNDVWEDFDNAFEFERGDNAFVRLDAFDRCICALETRAEELEKQAAALAAPNQLAVT